MIETEEQKQKMFPPKRWLSKPKNRNCSLRRYCDRSKRVEAENVSSEEIAIEAEERKQKIFPPKRLL
jgi:hypothetical protein